MWFIDTFLGEKYEAKDYLVTLIDPTCGTDATFYVQVKATTKGYRGSGAKQKLKANVTKNGVGKLREANLPAYVVGIDVINEKAYLAPITPLTTALNGIPTTHQIDCTVIKKLWNEVNDYWKGRTMTLPTTSF